TLSEKGGKAHLDIVGALAFSGDGLLASGGFRTVKLWRSAENPVVSNLPALAVDPAAASVSADGAWALVGDTSGGVVLHSLADPAKKPVSFKDHSAVVTGVAFTADGQIVTASLDKFVKARSAGGGGEARQIAELPSPIHSMVMIEGGNRIACGCEDGVIRLVSLEGEIAELKAHGAKVTALATSGKALISAGADAKLFGWNLDHLEKPTFEANNSSPVIGAALSPDGTRFATIAADKTVRLWNGADLKHITDLKTDNEAIRVQGEAQDSQTVAIGIRDGRKIALDAATKKIDEEKGKAKTAAEAEVTAITELMAKLSALGDSEVAKRRADEAIAAKLADANSSKAATDAMAKAQTEADDATRKRVETGRNAELAVRFSSRAAEAAAAADAALAAAEAGVIAAKAALEAAQKASAESVKALTKIAFSADGAMFLASAEDGNLYAWGAGSGAAAGSIPLGTPLASLAAVADGRVLGVGSNKSVAIYETSPKWTLERTIGSLDDAETFTDRINTVAFSYDGRTLATGGGVPSRGGELKLWRVRDGEKIAENIEEHSDSISAVAFSPDGRHVATAATDRFVKVFSAEDATFERSFEGHTNHVLDVSWRADGLVLASSGADNVVKVWDFEAGTQKQTVKGHSKPVTSVSFVGNGGTLVSSSGDKTVRLGDLPLPDTGTFMHVAEASDDGKMIAAGGEDSVLRIWSAADKKILLKLR
ncbi:MAG: WD40 repeat protein, partial [Verrucomicrobiales bacterium]